MDVPIFVDAFAPRPFTGNPAGVCLLLRPAPRAWMMRVAAEMKHAETAFVSPHPSGFRLRWFTPTTEVDLCGHATLAAAHVLWESGALPTDRPAVFRTRGGTLRATRTPQAIEIDFPLEPAAPAVAPTALRKAVPGPYRFVGRNRYDYLVEIDSPARLRSLVVDLDQLRRVPVRGMIVTCRSDRPKFDFLYRFFAPRAGVPEDSATGSAQCALAPYWGPKVGKERLSSFQASERTGVLGARVVGNRVRIEGQAFTILSGRVAGPPSS